MVGMISMAMDDEAISDAPTPIAIPDMDKPRFPYGLCISLTDDELDKLGIDVSEAKVGGVFHLEGLARITSVSLRDGEGGPCCRLEAQIEDLAVLGGDEPDQAETSLPTKRGGLRGMYKST